MRRLAGDRAGGVAVLIALAMPVVVGGFGLGTEAGFWYFTERRLQHAADVAVFAAAAEMRLERPERASAAAQAAASSQGVPMARAQITVTPGIDGVKDRVEVRMTEDIPRRFTRLFGTGDVRVAARAVAEIVEGFSSCILALDPQGSPGIDFSGNQSSLLAGCSVHANSLRNDSINVNGNRATVNADCISTSGGVSSQTRTRLERHLKCSGMVTGAEQIPDPFKGLPIPSSVGMTCPTASTIGESGSGAATVEIEPGCFGNMTIGGPVKMAPGTYIVDSLTMNTSNAGLTGNGVTIFVRNSGQVRMTGGIVDLSAPTTGIYRNILIFGSPNSASGITHTINGNTQSVMEGIVYLPQGELNFTGGFQHVEGNCLRFVTLRLKFSGSSSIGSDCRPLPTLDASKVRRIRLLR